MIFPLSADILIHATHGAELGGLGRSSASSRCLEVVQCGVTTEVISRSLAKNKQGQLAQVVINRLVIKIYRSEPKSSRYMAEHIIQFPK